MRSTFKYLGWFLLLFALYIGLILLHGTLTDFQPEEEISLEAVHEPSQEALTDSILSFTIWNVGYGGLGAESNFFYDSGNLLLSNGQMIRPTRELVEKNVEGMRTVARSVQSDFFLLQEVDRASRRSYYLDEFEAFGAELDGYGSWFAANYQAPRVPLPLLEPWRAYGKVHSGLATYSRVRPTGQTRIQLPGAFPWPTRIFQLDRCAAVLRFPHQNGRELVLINVHNSAYDKTGELKQQQMTYLRELFLREYEAGHYVIVGGDWNQCPPYFDFDRFMPGRTQGYTQSNIEPDFLPDDWKWAYDPTLPSNRKVRDVYQKGTTFETLIDFFLVSPNVRVRQVKTINQEFQFSDHQPVWMEVELL